MGVCGTLEVRYGHARLSATAHCCSIDDRTGPLLTREDELLVAHDVDWRAV